MIGYVTVGVNDHERALAFYDALFETIGAKRLMEVPENGFTMYGTGWDQPGIVITRPYDGQPARVGNGAMVALQMDSRKMYRALRLRAPRLGRLAKRGWQVAVLPRRRERQTVIGDMSMAVGLFRCREGDLRLRRQCEV